MYDLSKNTKTLKEYLDCGVIPLISKYKIATQKSIFGEDEVCFKIYFTNSAYGVNYNGQYVYPNNVTLYMSNNNNLLRLFFLFNARLSDSKPSADGKPVSGVVVESISKKLNVKGDITWEQLNKFFKGLLFILDKGFPYI